MLYQYNIERIESYGEAYDLDLKGVAWVQKSY